MLLEIETRIEQADAYIAHHLQDDSNNFNLQVQLVKKDIKVEKASRELDTQNKKLEEEIATKRDKAKDRVVVTGVRKQMPVSLKRAVEKKKEKKIELTQDQMDMKKYGGDNLFQAFMDIKKTQ